MKKIISLLVCCFLYITGYCQHYINIDSVSMHVGETVTVCSKVYGTRFLSQSNKQPAFLNMGAAYPNSPLTIVVFGDDRKNFIAPPETMYANKDICVTGVLKEYRGKTEIIVNKQDEIEIKK